MKLERARVSNFRSLRDVTVEFGPHTALLGGNGAGKSSVLKALEKFYSTSRFLDKDDYFGRDQTVAVEIELTFKDLTEEETTTFEKRVRDGRLTVTRVFDTTSGSGRYYGVVPQIPEFLEVRRQPSATTKREAYRALREQSEFSALRSASSAAAVDQELDRWESLYPEKLHFLRDDGQFFGFQNAGRGALQRFTSFVFVPAVRDALTDAQDGRSSPIGKLLEIVVRSSILKRTEIVAFQEQVLQRYRSLVSPESMPELNDLAAKLTSDLRELYGNAAVGLDWKEITDIPIPLPAADVTLSDDGFGGPVDRQGHGLQRAFIFTLLQHLARASSVLPEPAKEGEVDSLSEAHATAPNLILAIEEPELYQHPTKQRHLSQVLRRLSSASLPGTTGETQIVFASHSPLFVSMAFPAEVRLVRREAIEGSQFKQCGLKSLDLAVVARKIETAQRRPLGSFTAESLQPRLHILGAELAEGFFADGIVLVEGRSDRAMLFAVAQSMGVDFESSGIAVLCAEGKNNIDRPYAIFTELGIPVYVIWDCDCGTNEYKPKPNLHMNRLLRPHLDLEVADETDLVSETYAHFSVTLEECIIEQIGRDIYQDCLSQACLSYGFDASKDAQKIPSVMSTLLQLAHAKGKQCDILCALVRAIWRHLKGQDLSILTENGQIVPRVAT